MNPLCIKLARGILNLLFHETQSLQTNVLFKYLTFSVNLAIIFKDIIHVRCGFNIIIYKNQTIFPKYYTMYIIMIYKVCH